MLNYSLGLNLLMYNLVLSILFVVPLEEDDKDPSTGLLDHNYHESILSMFKPISGRLLEHGFGIRTGSSPFGRRNQESAKVKGYCWRLPSDDRLVAVFVVGFSLGEDSGRDEQLVLFSQSGSVNRSRYKIYVSFYADVPTHDGKFLPLSSSNMEFVMEN